MFESLPVLFINCSVFPFVTWILSGLKVYETRNRNTLKCLLGKQVYLCETGKKQKIVRCKATISGIIPVSSKQYYEKFRKECCILPGSTYDFIPGKKKHLYLLTDIVPVPAFVPEEGKHYGYTYMDFNGIKKII